MAFAVPRSQNTDMYTLRTKTYMIKFIGSLLLFSDEQRLGLEDFDKFQLKEAGSISKHHVQTGLSEGHSMLVLRIPHSRQSRSGDTLLNIAKSSALRV